MTPNSYIFFNGNCGEAMRFYEQTLGGKLEMMMTYGESPEGEAPPNVAPDKIMHAYLKLGDGALMASDDMNDSFTGMKGFSISITYPTVDEAKKVFAALSEGGTNVMPMEKTFWSEAFGMVTDRFGTPWMVSVDSK